MLQFGIFLIERDLGVCAEADEHVESAKIVAADRETERRGEKEETVAENGNHRIDQFPNTCLQEIKCRQK